MFDSESPSVCSLSKRFAARAVAARSSRCEAPPGQPWWIPAANAAKPLNEESSFPIRSAVWQEAMFDLRVLSGHRWLVWFLEQEDHLQTGPGQIHGKCVMCAIVTCAVPSVIEWCLSCSIITSFKWQPKIILSWHFFPLSRSQLYWFMQGNLLVFTHNALRCSPGPARGSSKTVRELLCGYLIRIRVWPPDCRLMRHKFVPIWDLYLMF